MIKRKNLLPRIKMCKEILTFWDIEIEKNKFYRRETPIILKYVNIEKELVSNQISLGGKKIINTLLVTCAIIINLSQLHTMVPKTSTYVKGYDGQTKWMYFLIEDDDLKQKYNTIWNKVSADIKEEFDNELVYNKEFLITKIKSHGDEVTDFYDKKIPKADSSYTCLAVISLDSALSN